MNTKTKTRKGKHRKGNVRMGIYVEPRRKAIALMTAEVKGWSMTDVIWLGIETLAIGYGILDKDGNVTKEFKNRFDATLAIVEQSEVNG